MSERFLCFICEQAAGVCLCENPPFRFRRYDHADMVYRAAVDLVEALKCAGYGSSSEWALPGEFDTLEAALEKYTKSLGYPQAAPEEANV